MLQKYYWGTVRKAVVAFGNMFNAISIDRLNADGTVGQSIRVPLAYAPRQKFLARINEMPGDDRIREVVVPRMAFEMKGLTYDPSRKMNMMHQNRKLESNTQALTQYTAVPWNMNMMLYVYSKNQDDGLQVIEQILPYFNPDFNLTLKAMPTLSITNDLPVILNSVEYEDNYEGSFEDNRKIFWTLDFTLKMNFFGPLNRQGVIKKVTENLIDYNTSNVLYTYTGTVDPQTAGPDDAYTLIETFDEF